MAAPPSALELPPPPRHFHSIWNSLPHASQKGKCILPTITLPIEEDTAKGMEMWPPKCTRRHLCHIRDASLEAPERCLGPLPHHCLPWQLPVSCSVLAIPCLGLKGSNSSTGLSSAGFSSPQQVWVELHRPVGSRALSFLCQASGFSWESVLELGREMLDSQEFPELLEAPHLPQLCPGATTPPIPSGARAAGLPSPGRTEKTHPGSSQTP